MSKAFIPGVFSFRIRDGLDYFELLDQAREIFAPFARGISFSHDDLNGLFEIDLELVRGHDVLNVRMTMTGMGDFDVSHSLSRDLIFDLPFGVEIGPASSDWWTNLLEYFIARVSKPWSEWTEEEIMSSPKWCRYFVEAGNEPTGTMHTMMVMKSFEDSDVHVRGYFSCLEKRRIHIT